MEQTSAKLLLNIGCMMDIPTGKIVKGKQGESIINGGLAHLTGVTGIGNSFKSTIAHFMMLSAADKFPESYMMTYDTETNTDETRLAKLATKFMRWMNSNPFITREWIISDKTNYYGNEWFTRIKDYLKKKAEGKNYRETPFMDRDRKEQLKAIVPTFSEIDSLTEFETADIAKIQDEAELGDSAGLTMHMRQALAKMRMLMDLPTLAGKYNHFFLMTAHLGKDIPMNTGPIPVAPTRKLFSIKNGDKIKGVSDKFFFLLHNLWSAQSVIQLTNQGTKGPEYPLEGDSAKEKNADLSMVSLHLLRSKFGPSGVTTLEVIVSQSEGVLPTLSEFHYIKSWGRFGLSGSLQHYSLDLLPEESLQRTTVRTKIDNSPKLRRAMNITSELCQMHQFWKDVPELSRYLCSAKELYDSIKALGYDWDMILDETRGWYTYDNYNPNLPYFLSTWDLLLMRAGEYTPFWLEDYKKKNKK